METQFSMVAYMQKQIEEFRLHLEALQVIYKNLDTATLYVETRQDDKLISSRG
jgi:hypothetical protein